MFAEYAVIAMIDSIIGAVVEFNQSNRRLMKNAGLYAVD